MVKWSMLNLCLQISVTYFKVSIGVGESIWHDRAYLPTEIYHKWKSWISMAAVSLLIVATRSSILISDGALSIKTLMQLRVIGVTVKKTIKENKKVQIGSTMVYSGLK